MVNTMKKQEKISIENFVALEEELYQLRQEHHIEVPKNKVLLFFDQIIRRSTSSKRLVYKKKYLLFAIFTGWFGGQYFYIKRYKTAFCYLLLFWTGFPIAMTIIDLLAVSPLPSNEEGMVEI